MTSPSLSLAVAVGVEKCALQTCGVRGGFDIQLSLVRQELAKSADGGGCGERTQLASVAYAPTILCARP